MKHLFFIFISVCMISCTIPNRKSYRHIIDYTNFDQAPYYAQWHGHKWDVRVSTKDSIYTAMTATENSDLYDSLYKEITTEIHSKPIYEKVDIPSYKDEIANDTYFSPNCMDSLFELSVWYQDSIRIDLSYCAISDTTTLTLSSLSLDYKSCPN